MNTKRKPQDGCNAHASFRNGELEVIYECAEDGRCKQVGLYLMPDDGEQDCCYMGSCQACNSARARLAALENMCKALQGEIATLNA